MTNSVIRRHFTQKTMTTQMRNLWMSFPNSTKQFLMTTNYRDLTVAETCSAKMMIC